MGQCDWNTVSRRESGEAIMEGLVGCCGGFVFCSKYSGKPMDYYKQRGDMIDSTIFFKKLCEVFMR